MSDRAAVQRRQVLKSATGLLFLFSVGGAEQYLTPAAAFAAGAELRLLSPAEAEGLGLFAETLVPGAREAGVIHYIDANLARPPGDCLLMSRYVDIAPPFVDFYRAGLAALDRHSHARHGAAFARLALPEREALVRAIAGAQPEGWSGPPAPLFSFVVRADAVDMVYGTAAAFERLGLPYLAHIEPKTAW